MATKFIFDNKLIKLPGVYSTIKSGIKNVPTSLSYGNILIIDNGSGATFGGGAGIAGELSSGQNAIYEFDNLVDFRNFTKGGLWWALGDPLFNPETGAEGVSKIIFAKAAATTAGQMTFAPTGGGTAGGTFVVNTIDEGVIANGVEVDSVLTKGYCHTFSAGEVDTAKFILKFWVGQYKGLHADGIPYDGVYNTQVAPMLLCKSPEFSNIQEVFDWAAADSSFNTYFKVKTATKTGTGAITAADLSAITGNRLATLGTETYNTTHLSTLLDAIAELDYSLILCDKYGDDAQGTENGLILNHILNVAKFEKMMIVAGGTTSAKFAKSVSDSSLETADYYNSDRVIVVHGGVKKKSNLSGSGFRLYDSIYKAAAITGRIAGLPPQVPLTFKHIKIEGEQHNLTKKELEASLDGGCLVTYFDNDFQRFTVLQGVNSLQRNSYLVNNDGTTYSIQLRRITSQINKELVVNIKLDLLGQTNGVNRNTLTEASLKDYVKVYLSSKVATITEDDLIISYRNISVSRNQDAYMVSYEIVPNGEITKIFVTGFLVD